MKHRIAFINLPLLAVFLVLASTTALAGSTWYVDGDHNGIARSSQRDGMPDGPKRETGAAARVQ